MHIITKLLLGIVLTMSTICYAEEAKEAANTNKMILNTNAFLDKSMLPTLYTCDGKNISPQLDWTGIPDKTASLALVMNDPSSPSGAFYHWVVYNIPKTAKEIPQGGKTPKGSVLGMNSFKKQNYSGPCPAKGTSHTYNLTLYALDTELKIPADADPKTIMTTLKKHVIGKVGLSAVYSRWIQ